LQQASAVSAVAEDADGEHVFVGAKRCFDVCSQTALCDCPFDGTVSCVFLSCCGSAASSYCRLMARSRLSYFPRSGHCERLAVVAADVGLQRCAFRLQFCLVSTKAYSRRNTDTRIVMRPSTSL